MFKDDIKLEIDHLDKAALDQPSLYAEWGENWANAILKKDRTKEALSAAKSNADAEIRANPFVFGWNSEKNPTEAWVANQIALHEKVVELESDLIDAQYEVNMMGVAKESLDHRKKSLEILAMLYTSSYFVGKARTEKNYVETLIEKGAEAQTQKLEKSPRMKRNRKEDV